MTERKIGHVRGFFGVPRVATLEADGWVRVGEVPLGARRRVGDAAWCAYWFLSRPAAIV
jgi:hypothetical protein